MRCKISTLVSWCRGALVLAISLSRSSKSDCSGWGGGGGSEGLQSFFLLVITSSMSICFILMVILLLLYWYILYWSTSSVLRWNKYLLCSSSSSSIRPFKLPTVTAAVAQPSPLAPVSAATTWMSIPSPKSTCFRDAAPVLCSTVTATCATNCCLLCPGSTVCPT